MITQAHRARVRGIMIGKSSHGRCLECDVFWFLDLGGFLRANVGARHGGGAILALAWPRNGVSEAPVIWWKDSKR